MIGVILVAGMGRRLRPLTENYPKSLINIDGKVILEYIIDNMLEIRIRRIYLVVGYLSKMIKRYISEKWPRIDVRYIYNPNYETTNTAYSLFQAIKAIMKEDVLEDIIINNGDTIVGKEDFVTLSNSKASAILVDKNSLLDDEAVKVYLCNDKTIITKRSLDCFPVGEYIGVCKILISDLQRLYLSLKNLIKKDKMAYYDDALGSIYPKIVYVKTPWIEIDDFEDLRRAKRMFSGL